MLTVWCVLWGNKYHPAYVYALREGVARHLSAPHRFVCVTDRDLPGVETISPVENWQGWWNKLNLFALADGPSLYFDLDVIITGDLDYLVDYTANEFAAPANWAKSGHGGIQSSVMAWNGQWRRPFEQFDPDRDIERLWGDQEFIWELRGDDWVRIPGVYSYKYHCIGGLRGDESVVVFHGKPDPHEIPHTWTSQYTRTLRLIISDSMLHGFGKALENADIDCGKHTIHGSTQTSTSSAAHGTPSGNGSGIRVSS